MADRNIIIGRVINVTRMIGVSAGISLKKSFIGNEFGRFRGCSRPVCACCRHTCH